MARSIGLLGLLLVVICGVGCATSGPAASSGSTGDRVIRLEDRPLGVIGEIETLRIVDVDVVMPARIDTGATTSSLDARDIKQFERDGERWVRFTLVDPETDKKSELERPIARIVSIKRHGADDQERPVVEMKLQMGSRVYKREFSLTDRSAFTYPLLIGRNVLAGTAVVDVTLQNTLKLEANVE
ncbi:ATP-dependent zinc protease family protein [Mucisphaera calidilacus]|uniref:ATP-dependent zinc protease family protein n=1 Tax=Mucisphaera calidilacus TaxID=2527982 RepID=UPI001F1EAC95|nr:ATP-dependent zinc protease [Mucisphaera calidilacus]